MKLLNCNTDPGVGEAWAEGVCEHLFINNCVNRTIKLQQPLISMPTKPTQSVNKTSSVQAWEKY